MELLAIALGVVTFAQLFVWSRKGDCDCSRKHDASDWERRATEIEIANLRREVALLREIVLTERTQRRERQDGAADGPDT
jgi:hypothetical protein